VNPVSVSVIVPCRNEAGYLDAFLASVFAQVLPPGSGPLQVVVADGGSDDGTRERLAAWQRREAGLVVIDNPARITPVALNLATQRADGEVIVRMDVHTTYAGDYVAQCAAVLQATGASCVGGAWVPVGEGWPQRAIARAFESGFGSGGAASRRAGYEGSVDTVYLGAWRRDELLRHGGFDEALVRNQDDELNLRIVRSGGTVWQSPAIRSWYRPRASFTALFRQYFQYGYWKVAVIRKHRLPAAPRQLAPFCFVALILSLAVASLVWPPSGWMLALVVLAYAMVAAGQAAALQNPLNAPREAAGIFWAFVCMHMGYGLGFGKALLDRLLWRDAAGDAATRLTR